MDIFYGEDSGNPWRRSFYPGTKTWDPQPSAPFLRMRGGRLQETALIRFVRYATGSAKFGEWEEEGQGKQGGDAVEKSSTRNPAFLAW
jgi:hypothetical protein